MANICSNKFYLNAFDDLENFKKSKEAIINFIDNEVEGEITYEDEDILEGWFDSKWRFPMDTFENLLSGDIYFRCLSEEYGMEYVAMNIYNSGWQEEQTFDL